MKNLHPYESALGILGIVFLIGFFSVYPLGPSMVFAQDDAALFDELENNSSAPVKQIVDGNVTSTQDQPPPKEKIVPEWMAHFSKNFEGSLRLRSYYFFKEPENQTITDTSSLEGEALFRFATWSGTDDLKLKVSGWAEAGTLEQDYQGKTYWLQNKDNDRQYFELNEVYAFASLENVDITLGKKLFNTGICTLFSPSDRFQPMDLYDPLDPKQFGLWQAKVDYYPKEGILEGGTITAAILPVYTTHKVPPLSSRWWGEFANNPIVGQIQKEYPDISLKNIDYFARYKTTRNGWDFFLSTNTGLSPYSVVKLEGTNYIEEIIRIYTLAGGFSTTTGGFEIHGETLYNLSEGDKDQDYLSSVLGFTYTLDENARRFFMEEIVFTLEYAREIILDQQHADNYIINSQEGRPGTNALLSRLQLKYDQKLTFENLFHYDISDQAWMNRFEISYRLGAGWTANCTLEVFGSQNDLLISGWLNFDNISYAQWKNNDRVVVSITYEF